MERRHLQYVLKVAECGSITRAAAELYITQPSLSNYLTKIEKDLGVQLFDRSVSPLQLTLAGKEYVDAARKILDIEKQTEKRIHDLGGVSRGQIRLGTSYERGSFMLPYILPRFRQMCPDTELTVTAGGHKHLDEALGDGKLDMIMLPALYEEKGRSYYPIYQEELLLCAGPGIVKPEHLLEGFTDTVDPFAVRSLPILRMKSGHIITQVYDLLAPAGNSNIVSEIFSNSEGLRLAAAGLGACIVPQITVDSIRCSNAARFYSVGSPPIFWQVYAITREGFYLSAAERTLIQIAADSFRFYTDLLERKRKAAR